MPANRQQPRVLFPNHSTQQRHIHNPLHILYPMLVMGDSHRPTKHRVLRLRINLRRLFDVCAAHSTRRFNLLPRQPLHLLPHLLKILRVLGDITLIHHIALQNRFGNPAQHRNIPPNHRLQIERRHLRPKQHAAHIRWHLEIHQPRLAHRIDHNDLPSAPPQPHE